MSHPLSRLAPLPAAARAIPAFCPHRWPPSAAGRDAGFAIRVQGPSEFARLDRPLRRTARRLAASEPLTIVAIGSSSTRGAGASSPAASYPSRLAAELTKRFPQDAIAVLNRGVNGEEIEQMFARLPTDVIAARPDLVLWQVGTNAVLRDHQLRPEAMLLRDGIKQIKDTGADLVLIDLQFAPRVIAKSETSDMEDQIARVAKKAVSICSTGLR